MKKFLALTAVATMMMPMSATAQQRIEVGKTYICSIEAIRSNSSICASVTLPSPASDLCVRVEATDRYVTSPVVLNDSNEAVCVVPVSFGIGGAAATTGGAAATTTGGAAAATTAAGLGGLAAATPLFIAVAAAGVIAAASGGGSSNGTN